MIHKKTNQQQAKTNKKIPKRKQEPKMSSYQLEVKGSSYWIPTTEKVWKRWEKSISKHIKLNKTLVVWFHVQPTWKPDPCEFKLEPAVIWLLVYMVAHLDRVMQCVSESHPSPPLPSLWINKHAQTQTQEVKKTQKTSKMWSSKTCLNGASLFTVSKSEQNDLTQHTWWNSKL